MKYKSLCLDKKLEQRMHRAQLAMVAILANKYTLCSEIVLYIEFAL